MPQDELAPRVEVLVDPSRSMAVSEERRERPRELAAPSLRLAAVQGLPAALYWLGGAPERCEAPLDEFEGAVSLAAAVSRVPLMRSGV